MCNAKAGVLVWLVTVLAGLGVLARGIVPVDFLVWLLELAFALWYSKHKALLVQHANSGLTVGPDLLRRSKDPVAAAETSEAATASGLVPGPPECDPRIASLATDLKSLERMLGGITSGFA
jgi:hypothetical protein